MNESTSKLEQPDANPDPITGAHGAHPVGVGMGSVGGATLGAVVGSLGGPIGTAVGAAIGGVAGGLTGKGIAEAGNPTLEDAYWREHYSSRPYVTAGAPYEAYQPSYRLGWEGRGRYATLDWTNAEPRLREDWRHVVGADGADWDSASPAVRDAWDHQADGHKDSL
ncbi:MAG: hypothetical protein NDJ94_08710 [Vicinamibacteria bacterium]|nr:hypothetical protein [Vicinamibacteria bacterium]